MARSLLLLLHLLSAAVLRAQEIACIDRRWIDDEGYDCQDYTDNANDPNADEDWCLLYGQCVNVGSSADRACCACGGGINQNNAPTAAPIFVNVYAPIMEYDDINCTLSPPLYIGENLTMQNFVNYNAGQLTMVLSYEGTSWIGIGFENDGRPGKPQFGIIGRADGRPVAKYNLYTSSEDGSGIVELPQGSQTLYSESFIQVDGKSILTFTKDLDEPFDVPAQIYNNETTTWVYAVGLPNNAWAGRHTIAGKFNIALNPCVPFGQSEWVVSNPAVGGGLADNNYIDPFRYFNPIPNYKLLWLIHGILLGAAWGIICPLGIASMILKKKSKKWSNIHLFAKISNLLLNCVGILIGVVATYLDEGMGHLRTDHSKVSLAVFAGLMIDVIVAFAKGDLQKAESLTSKETETEERDVILGIGGNLEVLPPDSPYNPRNKKKSLYSERKEAPSMERKSASEEEVEKRNTLCVWLQYVFGLVLLGVAWYACHQGYDLQTLNWPDLDWEYYYWGAGAVGVLFCIFAILGLCFMEDVAPYNSIGKRKPQKDLIQLDRESNEQLALDRETKEQPTVDKETKVQLAIGFETNLVEEGEQSPEGKWFDIDTICL
jgi:hypothetical protein